MGLTILVKDSTFKMKLKENATMVELSPPELKLLCMKGLKTTFEKKGISMEMEKIHTTSLSSAFLIHNQPNPGIHVQ